MQNDLLQTQTAPNTGNPQNVGETNSANESADFQQTAPQDLLTQEQRSLVVEETGQPLSSPNAPAQVGGSSLVIWLLLAGLVLAIGIGIWAARFFSEDEEEQVPIAPRPSKAKTATTTKRKTTKTKSGKPVKKRKKAAQKRR